MVQGLGWLVGLDSRGRGRKAKLSGEQKQALYELIVAGPQANGFDCGGVDLGDACGADLAALGCVLQPALPQQSVSETGAEFRANALKFLGKQHFTAEVIIPGGLQALLLETEGGRLLLKQIHAHRIRGQTTVYLFTSRVCTTRHG